MGIPGWLKKWYAQREAERLGKVFAKRGGSVLDWMKRNKRVIGSGFAAIAAWGQIQGCPPVLSYDVLAFVHLTCGQVNLAVTILGAFLVGAGITTSDKTEAVKQGLVAPEGPPKVMPEAELERIEKTLAEKRGIRDGDTPRP